MTDIVLFGIGTTAQLVSIYLADNPDVRIVGYTVNEAWRSTDRLNGLPVVAWERLEETFPPDRVQLFGPFSHAGMNALRRDRFLEGKARGYRYASFVHPASHVQAERIGENCLILEACVIQPFVRIGDNVVVWSMTMIGHHAEIGDHSFLSSQVGVGAHCRIGPGCYLAGQVGLTPGRTLGAGCALVNAVLVARDLPDNSVAQGAPARIRRVPSTRLHRLL